MTTVYHGGISYANIGCYIDKTRLDEMETGDVRAGFSPSFEVLHGVSYVTLAS
jgi:hypothetical protein